MNKEELFECLSRLSKTNNLRDGIDIKKEEANIIVNEIERLNKERSKTYENGLNYFLELQKKKDEIERLNNIIKEVRELVENGTDFKSIYFKKDNEDLWKVILSSEIKEKYLEILDKGE